MSKVHQVHTVRHHKPQDPKWPRRASLVIDGWMGRTYTIVEVIRETARLYEIRGVDQERMIKIAGRARWLRPGQTVRVPKAAIRFEPEDTDGKPG